MDETKRWQSVGEPKKNLTRLEEVVMQIRSDAVFRHEQTRYDELREQGLDRDDAIRQAAGEFLERTRTEDWQRELALHRREVKRQSPETRARQKAAIDTQFREALSQIKRRRQRTHTEKPR